MSPMNNKKIESITADNPLEMLPELDESGNTIGIMTRAEAHDGSQRLHPVVHLHIFNSHGELYLQHRPLWKSIQPDKWDTATGGHIEAGEELYDALYREVEEELGITDFTPTLITKYIFSTTVDRNMCMCSLRNMMGILNLAD